MSLEHFNQEGKFVTSQIAAENLKQPTTPAIEILAEKLIDSAKRGISLYAESRFDKTTNNLIIDQNFWDGLNRECSNDVGALVLGVGVISIHRSLADGKFSPLEFYSFWNSNLYNLPFFKAEIPPQNEIEVFTNEKIREMTALASADPTLVSFFEKENRYLRPHGLHQFIQDNHLKKHMRPAMHAFRSIAQTVLTPQPPDDTEITRRLNRLSHYDQHLSYLDGLITSKKESVLGKVLALQESMLKEKRQMVSHPDEVRSEISPLNLDFK